jgi:hypothetical protein
LASTARPRKLCFFDAHQFKLMAIMTQSDAPPAVLDTARVIAYAIVDDAVEWTGNQMVFVDGERLAAAESILRAAAAVHGRPYQATLDR